MNKRKLILLFLALALPVLIFLFLKFFGKNQFDLPVFHADNSAWPAECSPPAGYPYRPEVKRLVTVAEGKPFIILLTDLEPEARQRLPVELDTVAMPLVHPVNTLNPCLFGAPSGTAAVMLDENEAVRGIFATLDRDETDRLIMESKILLKNY